MEFTKGLETQLDSSGIHFGSFGWWLINFAHYFLLTESGNLSLSLCITSCVWRVSLKRSDFLFRLGYSWMQGFCCSLSIGPKMVFENMFWKSIANITALMLYRLRRGQWSVLQQCNSVAMEAWSVYSAILQICEDETVSTSLLPLEEEQWR